MRRQVIEEQTWVRQHCFERTRGTQAQTTDVELNQRFVVVRTRAVGNNRRWRGKEAGRQMSTWGLVILGQPRTRRLNTEHKKEFGNPKLH